MAKVVKILDNSDLDAGYLADILSETIGDEVEIILADPGYMKVLNRRYRHMDMPTDVLSFDLAGDESGRPEGSIYVDGRLYPPVREILERIFHGYLHLMGYSHDNEESGEIMRTRVDELVFEAMKRWEK